MRALEARTARRAEGWSVLSALCAEVGALTRLINHRGYLAGFYEARAENARRVSNGDGEGAATWYIIDLRQNYFIVFEALTPKLGLIDPYYASQITRFYTYLKSVSENYRPGAAFHEGLTAAEAVQALDNDIMLLGGVQILGEHIATFRPIKTPRGIVDPHPAVVAAEVEARAGSNAPSAPTHVAYPTTTNPG